MSDQQPEVADEVVDAPTQDEELRRSFESVGTALVEISRVQAGMAKLRTDFPLDVVLDVSTKKGMDVAVAGRAAYRSTKTALEAKRKEAKAPILALGARLDTVAGELKDQLQAGQDFYDGPIQIELKRKEDERLAREQAERDRVAALEARVDDIFQLSGRAVGQPSAEVAKKIVMLTALEIGDDFYEYKGRAAEAKTKTLARLTELLDKAEADEERAEQARRDAEEVARLRAEKEERDARDARERAEREAAEATERRQREEAAALERRQREEAEAAERRQREEEAARTRRREQFYNAVAAQTSGMSMADSADLRRRMYVLAQIISPNLGDETEAAVKHLASTIDEITALEAAVSQREADALAAKARELNMQSITLLTVSAEKVDQFDPAAGPKELAEGREMLAHLRRRAMEIATGLTEDDFGVLLGLARTALAVLNRSLDALEARCDAAEPKAPPAPEIPAPPAEPDGQMERQDSNDGAAIPAAEAGQDAGELSQVHTQAHLPSEAPAADFGFTTQHELIAAVVDVMKASTATTKRGKPHTWVVPHVEMVALKAALREQLLPGGQFYAEDGTLMNADGTRSIFDDLDE